MSIFNQRRFFLVNLALYLGAMWFIFRLSGLNPFFSASGREAIVLTQLLQSRILFTQIFAYCVIAIVLHVLPFLLIHRSASIIGKSFGFSKINRFSLFLVLLISFWLVVLALNQIHFPKSAFTNLLPLYYFRNITIFVGTISALILFVLGIAPALYEMLKLLLSRRRYLLTVLPASLLVFLWGLAPERTTTASQKGAHPDIILIGMDSVSPLHIKKRAKRHERLQTLLETGSLYQNALTPLGRTYPAWASVLTGKFPRNNGVRFNLFPTEQAPRSPDLLPKVLKGLGYHTIFAQDERRFSNIDESFGFDKAIGPTVGAGELVLTKISDLPLVNMALLLPGKKLLFPSIADNRADYRHFTPEEFTSEILDAAPERINEPLFLATHFCLTHYPYIWRNSPGLESGRNLDDKHAMALEELTKQVYWLLDGLKKKRRLENAIVVIFSDHGEAMSYGDGLWLNPLLGDLRGPANLADVPVPLKSTYSGHGTRILDRTEYSILLSFIGFGTASALFKPSRNDRLATLTDIMPTILGAIGAEIPSGIDGIDLNSPRNEEETRIVATETGIAFSAIKSMRFFNETGLIREAEHYYSVDAPSGKLVLRLKNIGELIAKKSYAIHTKEWMLAFVRSFGDPLLQPRSILIHKPSGKWSANGGNNFTCQPPLKLLAEKSVEHFGQEITAFMKTWPFQDSSKLIAANSFAFGHQPE